MLDKLENVCKRKQKSCTMLMFSLAPKITVVFSMAMLVLGDANHNFSTSNRPSWPKYNNECASLK